MPKHDFVIYYIGVVATRNGVGSHWACESNNDGMIYFAGFSPDEAIMWCESKGVTYELITPPWER